LPLPVPAVATVPLANAQPVSVAAPRRLKISQRGVQNIVGTRLVVNV